MRQGRKRSCDLAREKGLQIGLEEEVELVRKNTLWVQCWGMAGCEHVG